MANDRSDQPSYQIRVVHLFYVLTLLATAMATIGSRGIFVGLVVIGFWAFVFTSESRPDGLRKATRASVLVAAPLVVFLLLPAVSTPKSVSRRFVCSNNLKQIALALHNYHDQYQQFPPAYVEDKNGRPLHSWRVLLLPFLDQPTLYAKYDFSQAWDGPQNRKLLNQMPPVYSCPASQNRNSTSYVVVTAPTTMWPGANSCQLADITDGSSNTIMLIEHDQAIPWMAPTDLTLEEATTKLTSDNTVGGHHRHADFFHVHFQGRNVAFADGSVQFLGHGHRRHTWAELLTINDGNSWDQSDSQTGIRLKRARIGNWLRLGAFITLVLLPLPIALRPS